MTTQLRELSLGEIDAVSGANNQDLYADGLGIALAGIGITATGAGAPVGLALGVLGVAVMVSSYVVK